MSRTSISSSARRQGRRHRHQRDARFRGKKADAPELQAERNERFADLQEMLYANSRSGDTRSILLVLQGMDTAGKGGIVKHVVGAGNPQGIRYTSFGSRPRKSWRTTFCGASAMRCRPRATSASSTAVHYEDVLIVRVHDLVPPDVWGARYDEINAFEKELVDGGTTLIKVAMFVSLDEQKQRLAERLERPDKYWKYNPADVDERLKWPLYQEAYQAMLDRTSTDYAPWYVIPCDRKWYSRLAITELLIEALESSTCHGRRRFRRRGGEEAAREGLARARMRGLQG